MVGKSKQKNKRKKEESKSWLAWTKQSWKWRRSKEAPMRRSLLTADTTSVLMVESALGHVFA